jgi:ankyrin repeat protein
MAKKPTDAASSSAAESKLALAKEKAQAALLKAAKNDEPKAATSAILKGAQPDLADEHLNTPMHVAAMYGALRVIVLLHEHDSQLIHAANKGKRTPLETARRVGEEDAILLLESLRDGSGVPKELLDSKAGDDVVDDSNDADDDKSPEESATKVEESATKSVEEALQKIEVA